jgi:phosphatidate cytidylyltransferase
MPLNREVFFTRLGSAVVFSAVMLLGLLWNTWAFITLFFLINFLCLREYAQLLEKIVGESFNKNEKANFIFIGVICYLLFCLLPLNTCQVWLLPIFHRYFFYALGMLIGGIILFFSFKKSKYSWYLLSGIGYISLSLGLLVQLRYQSLLLPLALILMIWMNDTLAYLCGSFFGKRKFFPSISPKKTLEGTLGGIVFTFLLAYAWYKLSNTFTLSNWLCLALIASVVGTAGDLVESKLKRMAGVKDSGAMMPGHGGALDRFDSLLLAAPVAFLYCLVCVACYLVKVL